LRIPRECRVSISQKISNHQQKDQQKDLDKRSVLTKMNLRFRDMDGLQHFTMRA